MLSFSLQRMRGIVFCAAALVTAGASAQADRAAGFPGKAVHIVVPFVAGGGSDVAARLIATKLTAKWGQQVVVENKPGGNTVIATQAVARAPADGHTLLLANSTFAINPLLSANLPYQSSDLVPVGVVTSVPFLMVVHPSVKANNLKEMLATLRAAQPGEWNFATVGGSGIGRIAGELFGVQAGVKMQHVPYKGQAQVANDLLAGVVKFTIDPASGYSKHVHAGKLKALAVSSPKRLASLPDVPTFAEQGMPDYNLSMWFGLLAPADTPRPVVNKISAAVREVLEMPDVKEKLAGLEMDVQGTTPEAFQAYLKSEAESFANVIKAANIKAAE